MPPSMGKISDCVFILERGMSVDRTTIGLLGDGQLAQMTCLAGQALGLTMHVYAQSAESPAAQVADKVWIGALDDLEQLTAFAKAVSVVTYDTESLPLDSVQRVAAHTRACPSPAILAIAQNRIRERAFLKRIGVPIPRVESVESAEEAVSAARILGSAAILKTAEQGYDGKGQARVDRPEDAASAWISLGSVPCVLEERVEFRSEMSVIVAGSETGDYRTYPVIDNEHQQHILHISVAPSLLPHAICAEAEQIALTIARELSLCGLLAVEMFYTRDGRVLVNELAPRPHNSGHHTQLSADTSQFTQLCLAVTGQSLGSVEQRPAAMVNLLGDLFLHQGQDGVQPLAVYQHTGFIEGEMVRQYQQSVVEASASAGIVPIDLERIGIYFYGKKQARAGRKMGHAIAVADSQSEATAIVNKLYSAFAQSGEAFS